MFFRKAVPTTTPLALILDIRPPAENNPSLVLKWVHDAIARIAALANKTDRFRLTVSIHHATVPRSLITPLIDPVKRGQIEIATTSAVCIPLPLLPPEISGQLVQRNLLKLQEWFGDVVRGFFPPLLCTDESIGRFDFDWIAADPIVLNGHLGPYRRGYRYPIDGRASLAIVDRDASMKLAYGSFAYPSTLVEYLPAAVSLSLEKFCAAELGSDGLFERLIRADSPIELKTVSQIPLSDERAVPRAGSPRTWPEDDRPYTAWSDPQTEPQQLLWELIRKLLERYPDRLDDVIAWPMLLYASARPHWDPARVAESLHRIEQRIEVTSDLRALMEKIPSSMRDFVESRKHLRRVNQYMTRNADPQSRLLWGRTSVPQWHQGEFDTPYYPFEHPGYVPKPECYPF